ncbi:Hsp20/alpha crystallin family protein [archaeon]|nr:MAG: Hsp20/alpha crystallin family protein [archaeon]
MISVGDSRQVLVFIMFLFLVLFMALCKAVFAFEPGGLSLAAARYATMPRITPRLAMLSRRDPLLPIVRSAEDMARSMLGDFIGNPSVSREMYAFAPQMLHTDVHETEKTYVLHIDLPGIQKEDIHVSTHKHELRIRAERHLERKEEKGARYHLTERHSGSVQRSWMLPENADVKNIHADYKTGVLEVTIPKLNQEEMPDNKVQVNFSE